MFIDPKVSLPILWLYGEGFDLILNDTLRLGIFVIGFGFSVIYIILDGLVFSPFLGHDFRKENLIKE